MKNKILIVSLLSSLNVFALNIDSAINTALENNFALKEQGFIVDETKANLDGSYSAYKPKLDVSYTYNDRDELATGQIEKDSTLSTTISYNLFNGLSDRYNIKSFEDLFKSSKFTFDAKKQDLILNVKTAYINYLLKVKETNTMVDALKLYETQYKDSSNFFNQGLIAKNELLEVEVQMLQAKQNVQSAKSAQKIAKNELENILGTLIDENEKIEELSSSNEIKAIYDEDKILNRSELKALDMLVKNYQNKKKSTYGSYLPKVDASFSYNKYGDDASVDGRTGYPNSQEVGTISLNWNLYNGGKDYSSNIVYLKKVKQTMMQLEDLKLQIKLQYKKAIEEYNVSKLNFDTAVKALESSKLNYEIVSDKVKEGLSSNKDLIDANYLLTQSKQNYYSAYYNKYISIATIKRVIEEVK